MPMRRPSVTECNRDDPDHWCVVVDGVEEPPHAVQCPSCGSGPDQHEVAMGKLVWSCQACGHDLAIIPAQVEV